MVTRMAKRAALLAPIVLAALWIFSGPRAALSGAVGIAMALVNLWAAARIIGGVADNNPNLLLIGGMIAFTLGLVILGGVAYFLHTADVVIFPIVGFTLIGTHMLLVLTEARTAYPIRKPVDARSNAADARS